MNETALDVVKTDIEETPKNSVMAEALKSEIVRVCAEGDPKGSGLFTAKLASHLNRLIEAGREILLAERISGMDAEEILRRKLRRKGRKVNGYGVGVMMGSDDDDVFGDVEDYPLVQSSPVENFGMQSIRQMVEMAKVSANAPEKLVEAIAKAKSLGQEDLAKKLEDKLMSGLDGPLAVSESATKMIKSIKSVPETAGLPMMLEGE